MIYCNPMIYMYVQYTSHENVQEIVRLSSNNLTSEQGGSHVMAKPRCIDWLLQNKLTNSKLTYIQFWLSNNIQNGGFQYGKESDRLKTIYTKIKVCWTLFYPKYFIRQNVGQSWIFFLQVGQSDISLLTVNMFLSVHGSVWCTTMFTNSTCGLVFWSFWYENIKVHNSLMLVEKTVILPV